MNEIDMIIHWMRQSKMADIREELEKLAKMKKDKNSVLAQSAHTALREIGLLFKTASKDAPLP